MRFLTGEDDGDALRAGGSDHARHPIEFQTEHLPVKEENRGKRLVLRGCGDLTFDGQVRKKSRNLFVRKFPRMTLTVKKYLLANPIDVCFFRPDAQVAGANERACLVE